MRREKGAHARRAAWLAAVALASTTAAPADPPATLPPEAGLAVASGNVALVANLPEITAIGSRLLGDYLYVTGVDGLSIFDVGLTGLPIPVGALPLPHWQNEDVDTNGELLLISADHLLGNEAVEAIGYESPLTNQALTVLYVIDVSIPHAPLLLSRTEVPSAHTVTCILDCAYAWLAGDEGIDVVDLRNPSNPRTVGRFYHLAGNSHDVQVDANGVAWISGTGGLAAYRPVSDDPLHPIYLTSSSSFDNQFIIHNSLRPYAKSWKPAARWSGAPTNGEMVYVTEEDWLTFTNDECANDGTFQTGYYRQVGSTKRLFALDAWHLGRGTSGDLHGSKNGDVQAMCSAHYFDVDGKVAAVAWYEQGLRFLSVKDPTNIRQVGFWRPRNSVAVSARFVGEYLYVFDLVRGLDVLHFTGKASGPTVKTALDPARRSAPSPEWGLACRLPLTVPSGRD